MASEKKNLIHRMTAYIKSHFYMKLTIALAAIIILIAVIFYLYLQNQYLSFLNSETTQSDEAVARRISRVSFRRSGSMPGE